MFIMMLITVLLLPIYFGWMATLMPLLVVVAIPLALIGYGFFIIGYPLYRWFRYKVNNTHLPENLQEFAKHIADQSNALVDFRFLYPQLQTAPIQHGTRSAPSPFYCSREVGSRLTHAQQSLPPGMQFLISNCQRFTEEGTKSFKNHDFFDVTLSTTEGQELDLGPKFEVDYDSQGPSKNVFRRRKIMSRALAKVGFKAHPLQWWRWTYSPKGLRSKQRASL